MASVKIAYAASANLTLAVASLASSTTLVAGRASTAIDNSSNLYLDAILSGFVTSGTTPTAGVIEVWVYAQLDDAPTYPDSITGTDAAKTMTSAPIKREALALVASIPVGTTSNARYPFAPVSVASLFGGTLPERWGVFVVHNTVAALNATGTNHQFTYQGVTRTVA